MGVVGRIWDWKGGLEISGGGIGCGDGCCVVCDCDGGDDDEDREFWSGIFRFLFPWFLSYVSIFLDHSILVVESVSLLLIKRDELYCCSYDFIYFHLNLLALNMRQNAN